MIDFGLDNDKINLGYYVPKRTSTTCKNNLTIKEMHVPWQK